MKQILSRQSGGCERLLQETLRIAEEILRKIVAADHVELSVWANRDAPCIVAYYDTAGHKRPRTDPARRENPAYYREKKYDVVQLLDAPTSVPVFKSRISRENYTWRSRVQRQRIKSTFLHCVDLARPAALVATADVEDGITQTRVPLDLVYALGQAINSDLNFRQLEPDSWASRKPRVFIGSSSEGLSIAEALEDELGEAAECTVWSDGAFRLSKGTMESLEEQLRTIDFAILVATPDDVTTKRKKKSPSMRDNVLFELGFFMGALGRARTFLLHGSDSTFGLPSDLAGITTAKFASQVGGNARGRLKGATRRVLEAIAAAGLR